MNSFRLDGVRVLVVDDAPAVLDVVTAILVEHGAWVTAVGTAGAALDGLRRDRPTVLLSDLSMPDAGGWLTGQVRALPAEDNGASAGVLPAGFQLHVAKRVGVAELVDVVALLAAGRGTRGVDAAASMR
jgi:DNA-binding NarL/FixJ family response regulator